MTATQQLRHRVLRQINRGIGGDLGAVGAPPFEGAQADDDDPNATVAEIDPANARAQIPEAIETGRITYPPVETDTWPA